MLCGGRRLQVTRVFKFGGSSVRDAERMQEVAKIVEAFPEQLVRSPYAFLPIGTAANETRRLIVVDCATMYKAARNCLCRARPATRLARPPVG